MSKTLILMRHGKTLWNQKRRIQGRKDSPLLHESREQIVRLATLLMEQEKINRIYTSPLGRAIQTTEIVSEILKIPYQVNSLLVEKAYGILEGKKITVLEEIKKIQIENEKYDPWIFKVEGGESNAEVLKRVDSFVSNHVKEGTNLIISHIAFFKILLGYLTDWTDLERDKFHFDNSTIVKINLDESFFTILSR